VNVALRERAVAITHSHTGIQYHGGQLHSCPVEPKRSSASPWSDYAHRGIGSLMICESLWGEHRSRLVNVEKAGGERDSNFRCLAGVSVSGSLLPKS
jgi:hypothetical protein